ncbi:MAG: FKBP-type peptidyl-prolyl cis-trans isomerase [Pirellulaceae bacterium]
MKLKVGLLLTIACLSWNVVGMAQEAATQQELTLDQKACYLLAFNFANELKAQSVEVDMEQMMKGMNDGLVMDKPAMSQEEIQALMMEFSKVIDGRMQKKFEAEAMANAETGEKFLQEYPTKNEGVVKMDSGVMYRYLNKGTGEAKPMPTEQVKVHYKGQLVNGKVFDSSLERGPATFAVGGLIRGFTEGLQQMHVGDKIELVIPSELGYGTNGSGPIGPNEVLIFEVELLDIVKPNAGG